MRVSEPSLLLSLPTQQALYDDTKNHGEGQDWLLLLKWLTITCGRAIHDRERQLLSTVQR